MKSTTPTGRPSVRKTVGKKMSFAGRTILAIGLFSGCSSETPINSVAATNPNDSSKSNVAPTQGIDVSAANSTQCSNGGNVFSIYLDENQNGVKDSRETVVSAQIICNGANGSNGANGVAGSSGANGSNGTNGSNGSNGSNGHGIAFKTFAAPVSSCPAGGTSLVIAPDVDDNGIYNASAPNQELMTICNGEKGADGQNGSDGTAGSNGQDGHDGHDGQDALTPAYATVEPILPCGNTVAYKEVLLRLANGQVLASFSNDTSGSMTRLAFLPDGSFMDTDTSGCTFSLSTSADGTERSISWSGQVQKTWAITAQP